MNEVIIFTDGGAQGNPGKAGAAFVIYIDGKIKEYAVYVGERTNNEAEYLAVILALEKLKQLLGKERSKKTKVIINLDSELVSKQLRGEYKILEENLQKLFMKFWNLKFDFGEIEIKLIPREENKRADKLVKKIIFGENKKLF
ncbi:MAG: ribonuclease HI family protein [Candidatus Pacebacteria bacterium]|jgi:ribonuclease HI|nr:ribonuclease HI family protein [Candidatus Paceibacterota bacterium]